MLGKTPHVRLVITRAVTWLFANLANVQLKVPFLRKKVMLGIVTEGTVPEGC